MKQRVAFVLVILVSLATMSDAGTTKVNAEDWRQDKVCGHKLGDPFQVDTPGCDDAYCINVATSSQVCACLISKETGTTQITYKRNGVVILQWDANIYPPAVASALRVDAADLNADGKEELVIATMNSASNGMGVYINIHPALLEIGKDNKRSLEISDKNKILFSHHK